MSAASPLQSKFHLGIIVGGRAKTKPKEILCTRADGLHFRGQTLAIVRHFFEMSCQLGRLPSILGREFFRAKVSHHAIPSFEDQALFSHDVQHSLMKLGASELEVLTLVGLYDLNLDEAARVLHCSAGYLSQRFAEALAHLTQIFL